MPMLDDRTLTPDPQLAPFVVWSWDDNRTGWQGLLGDAAGGPDTPAYAAPARVADLAGLPPAVVGHPTLIAAGVTSKQPSGC